MCSPISCPACPRNISHGWSLIRKCTQTLSSSITSRVGAVVEAHSNDLFECFSQEAQDTVADQGWSCDRRDLLPNVSLTGLYRNRLLCCHLQWTGQGESAPCLSAWCVFLNSSYCICYWSVLTLAFFFAGVVVGLWNALDEPPEGISH